MNTWDDNTSLSSAQSENVTGYIIVSISRKTVKKPIICNKFVNYF